MSTALVLLVFALFAVLMYRRIMPAIVAVPLMAVGMALGAGVPFVALGDIVALGSIKLANYYVAVIFGALLGRVTLDTGIARALVNLAAEYGGENPLALALGLCAIVALLFTSLSGLGAVIMVGSIVLPVLMTAGVPRTIAATLFLMAFALGFIFNIANWTFYGQFFGVQPAEFARYAIVLAAIDALAIVLYAVVAFARERGYATWAVRAQEPVAPRVPAIALSVPLLPLVFYDLLRMPPVAAFSLAAIFGVLITRPRDAIQTLVGAAIRGVEDVAPAILLFMGIGMLLQATSQPQFVAVLAPLGGAWVRNPLAFVAVFGLLSPLALYRGPLNPFGVGIVVFTVLLQAHAIPAIVLVAAMMAVVQVQNVCDPTNTANVWVANFTGVSIETILRRTLPYQVAVATLATVAVVAATPQILGVRTFAELLPRAMADTIDGFYAPPAARDRIAVDAGPGAYSQVAADAVADALRGSVLVPLRVHEDPNLTDCSRKPYAAYLLVSTSTFALTEGTDLDVGLRLEDCGGWIIQEWHDHRVAATPGDADARALAAEGVARMQQWSAREPARSGALFERGVARAPSEPASAYYAFFKTLDGNMRLYVRAGGPAYVAGARSGDVLDKLDGRFWWEYGTFQTQARAYDGKPHLLEIERAGKTIDLEVGIPHDPGPST